MGVQVMEEMNALLCKEFTEQEVSDTLFQIGPLKAPGPDGILSMFFQQNWATLKKEVLAVVLASFR